MKSGDVIFNALGTSATIKSKRGFDLGDDQPTVRRLQLGGIGMDRVLGWAVTRKPTGFRLTDEGVQKVLIPTDEPDTYLPAYGVGVKGIAEDGTVVEVPEGLPIVELPKIKKSGRQ